MGSNSVKDPEQATSMCPNYVTDSGHICYTGGDMGQGHGSHIAIHSQLSVPLSSVPLVSVSSFIPYGGYSKSLLLE